MASKRISLKLTPEQRGLVNAATGTDAEAIELDIEELEERIAPMVSRTPNPAGPVPIPYPNIGK